MDTTLAATAPQTLIPEPRTLSEKLATLPLKPLLLLGMGAAALAAVAIALALRSVGTGSDYKVLFSGLSDKDGGAVIAQLSQMNVPYRHSEGGGAILVPSDQVLDVRMRLSNLGLPKHSVVGYELLDAQKFGQTQAGEGMSMKRATEGELMRTIGSLSAVQQVRVHLALPSQNGFFREQQKPSASVMLTLHPGRSLDRAQLAGIVHLVSSSVPELSPKSVSVVDGSGTLLTQQDSAGQGLDAQQLQYVQWVESGLQKRVQELLEPVVGRENLRASITAEIDFSETLSVSEEFKPNNGQAPAAVKSQQTLESSQNGSTAPSGVPGAQTNQPPVPATAPVTGAAQAMQGAQGGSAASPAVRRESSTSYEVDKTQRTTRNATGTVRRLSAAVVVNHRSTTDNRGRVSTAPLAQEELDKLTALVEQGIGLNKDRGDTVKVINAPFRSEPAPKIEEVPLWKQPWVLDALKSAAMPLALAFVALLIVMTTIRPALKSLLAPPVPAPGSNVNAVLDETPLLPGDPAAAGAGAAGAGGSAAGEATGSTSLALATPQANPRIEEIRAMARQNPAAVALILRGFINGEQASA